MRAHVSWQHLIRNGIPPLSAVRRPLAFGDHTFAVGEVLTGLPEHRLRQFYEQRKAAPVAAIPSAEVQLVSPSVHGGKKRKD